VNGDETSAPLPGLPTVTVANAGAAVRMHRRAKENAITFLIKIEPCANGSPCGQGFVEGRVGLRPLRMAAEESTTFDWLGLSERGQRAPEPELATFCMLRQAQRRMILQGAFEHSSRAYDKKADKQGYSRVVAENPVASGHNLKLTGKHV
jgi:hypothetical protein